MIKLLSLMIMSVIVGTPIAAYLALKIEDWKFERYDTHRQEV